MVLRRSVASVRNATDNRRGLTALGSLDHYKGDNKQIEDITELMTMYAWNPGYAEEFTHFLADPAQKGIRRQVGLADLSQASANNVLNAVQHAVEDNL